MVLEGYDPKASWNDRERWTKVQDMHNHSFVVFWEEFNYGGEQSEPYKPLSEAEFIGTFTRRNPNTGDILQVHPSININLDKSDPEIRINYDIFKYAFESQKGNFSILPQSQMHIIFFSHYNGLIIKVPATFLLFLAQDAYPLDQISLSELQKLANSWEYSLNVFEGCTEYRRNLQTQAYIHDFMPYITFRKDLIFQIPRQLAEPSAPRMLSQFVEEVWELTIDPDNQFSWDPVHIRDTSTKVIKRLWDMTGRLKKVSRIGEKFHLDQRYRSLEKEQMPKLCVREIICSKLETEMNMEDNHLDTPHIHYPTEEILLPKESPINNFRQFYRKFYNRDLIVLEADHKFVLCREVDKHPNLVLVQLVTYQSLIHGSDTGGMFSLFALLNCDKEPLRMITYKPNESVIEEGSLILRDILMNWFTEEGGKIDKLLNLLSWVRFHYNLRLNIGFGDFLRNAVIYQDYSQSKQYLTNILRMFQFIEDAGEYNELEVNLDRAKEIYKEEIEKIQKRKKKEAEKSEWGSTCFPDDDTFHEWYSEEEWISKHKDDWIFSSSEDDD